MESSTATADNPTNAQNPRRAPRVSPPGTRARTLVQEPSPPDSPSVADDATTSRPPTPSSHPAQSRSPTPTELLSQLAILQGHVNVMFPIAFMPGAVRPEWNNLHDRLWEARNRVRQSRRRADEQLERLSNTLPSENGASADGDLTEHRDRLRQWELDLQAIIDRFHEYNGLRVRYTELLAQYTATKEQLHEFVCHLYRALTHTSSRMRRHVYGDDAGFDEAIDPAYWVLDD